MFFFLFAKQRLIYTKQQLLLSSYKWPLWDIISMQMLSCSVSSACFSDVVLILFLFLKCFTRATVEAWTVFIQFRWLPMRQNVLLFEDLESQPASHNNLLHVSISIPFDTFDDICSIGCACSLF